MGFPRQEYWSIGMEPGLPALQADLFTEPPGVICIYSGILLSHKRGHMP